MKKPTEPEAEPVEFVVQITRRRCNPRYKSRESHQGYDNRSEDEREPYLEQSVTSATLTPEQWVTVQRAIIQTMSPTIYMEQP